MKACLLSLTVMLACVASEAIANEVAFNHQDVKNSEFYFFSCHDIDSDAYLSSDFIASPFDPGAVLVRTSEIEPVLEYFSNQVNSGVGSMVREIAAELENVRSNEYRSQLNSLLSKLRVAPEDFFSLVSESEELTIFRDSKFVNVWYSDYRIDTEDCAIRDHPISNQLRWTLPDDLLRLKLIAEGEVSPTLRGALGDLVEVSGAVTSVGLCDSDPSYQQGDCVRVTLETDTAIVNISFFVNGLEIVSTLNTGEIFESDECLITELSVDTFGIDDAFSTLQPDTVVRGALFFGGTLLGLDAGVSGMASVSEGILNEFSAGSEAHVERLQVNCSTKSLYPLNVTPTSDVTSEMAHASTTSNELSAENHSSEIAKTISDVLLLVDQGALERPAALLVIKKLIEELDAISRTQLLAAFVIDERVTGDELVVLLD